MTAVTMRDSGFFLAGWLTCAVMSGALLLLAVRAYVEEGQDDSRDAPSEPRDSPDTPFNTRDEG